MYTIISAFHAVAELDPQTHARFALQTVSFFYKNLRERISNLILAMEAACVSSKGSPRDEKSFEMSFIQKQWALKQLKRKDQHLWRPQKGLPERSVSVLRAWMFQNFSIETSRSFLKFVTFIGNLTLSLISVPQNCAWDITFLVLQD
ncbi:hypothetical protein Leryth_000573 [Lithospermum erythrorhizon]|nr:hypothetical protein Leryth_000573 [Lithospermum erythrorhizon]